MDKTNNLIEFIFGGDGVEDAREFLTDTGKDPDKIAAEGVELVNKLIKEAEQKLEADNEK